MAEVKLNAVAREGRGDEAGTLLDRTGATTAEQFAQALPVVKLEDTSSLERTMLRLFGEELRAESAYRSALAASSSSSLGQAFMG